MYIMDHSIVAMLAAFSRHYRSSFSLSQNHVVEIRVAWLGQITQLQGFLAPELQRRTEACMLLIAT